MTDLSRRTLLRGLTFVACAPAIVRVSSLMPVRAWGDARGYLTLYKWALLPYVDARESAVLLTQCNDVLKEMVWTEPLPNGLDNAAWLVA